MSLRIDWRKPAAAGQVGRDYRTDVRRCGAITPLETERHHGDRDLASNALCDADGQFGGGVDGQQTNDGGRELRPINYGACISYLFGYPKRK